MKKTGYEMVKNSIIAVREKPTPLVIPSAGEAKGKLSQMQRLPGQGRAGIILSSP